MWGYDWEGECFRLKAEISGLRIENMELRKELAYWEHIGRDKLDVELMRGFNNEQTQRQEPK